MDWNHKIYDPRIVGDKIRRARKANELSQEALAALSEIDRSYLGRLERGEANISLRLLYRIAYELGCPVFMLIPDETDTAKR